MKNLLLLALIVLSILSCNGNKTKSDTIKASVEKFKDSLGTLENEEYIPQEYSEVKTDTILSNGFSISIKTYTDMKRFVTFKYNVDEKLTHIDKYRDWISEVKIKKNDILIFDKQLNANFFVRGDNTIKDSLNNAINSRVWVKEDFTNDKDTVYLIGGFIFPESEKVIYYDIKIDSKGNYSLKKMKLEYE